MMKGYINAAGSTIMMDTHTLWFTIRLFGTAKEAPRPNLVSKQGKTIPENKAGMIMVIVIMIVDTTGRFWSQKPPRKGIAEQC